MALIENEQTRLLATALNTAATSSLTVGVLAPLAAAFYNVGGTTIAPHTVVIGVALWFIVALSLHVGARHVLEWLDL